MIELTIHMNSSISDVLEWKCCNLTGLNLELIFYNPEDRPQAVPRSFRLESKSDDITVDTVYPPWPQEILPKDYASIYCNMNDSTWLQYDTLIVADEEGREYRFPLRDP